MDDKIIRDQLLKLSNSLRANSGEHLEESNKYEFGVCNLLLNGAAGAFPIYFAFLAFTKANIKYIPLVLWGISLFLGIAHQLKWRKILADMGYLERESASKVSDLLYASESERAKEFEKIIQEESDYHKKVIGGKGISQSEFKYVPIEKSLSVWRIWTQFVLIVAGILWAILPFDVISKIFLLFGK